MLDATTPTHTHHTDALPLLILTKFLQEIKEIFSQCKMVDGNDRHGQGRSVEEGHHIRAQRNIGTIYVHTATLAGYIKVQSSTLKCLPM